MNKRTLNAPDAPDPVGAYAQAVEVTGAQKMLFISGQIPVAKDGAVPSGFEAQCRQAWANLKAQLQAADMTLDNVVKITMFLADRKDGLVNRAIRQEMLGDRRPALTVIITGIFDAAWFLEIEAIAVA
jgi:enamine deaminase RidA (YjgF/YER057c/UK114 family)